MCLSAELGHNAAPLWQTRLPHGVCQPPGQRGPTDAIHLLGTALQWSCVVWLMKHLAHGRIRSLCKLPGVRLRFSAEEPTNLARMLRKPSIMKLARLSKTKKVHYQTSSKQKMAISFHVEDAGGRITMSNFHFTRENNWLFRLWVYKSINPLVILELRQAFSLSWVFSELCLATVSLTVKTFHPPLQQGDRVLREIGSHIHISEIAAFFFFGGIKTQMPW